MIYQSPPVDDKLIWDVWLSSHYLPAVNVATEIGLFPALSGKTLTAEELAAALKVNARALTILLSLLAALGFVVRQQGRYGLTTASRTYLVPGSDYFWDAQLRIYRDGNPAYERLLKAVRQEVDLEGAPAAAWEAGEIGIEQARMVAGFMHGHSLPAAVGAARTGLFDDVGRLLDVGAGSGCFAIAIAQHVPTLKATLMELAGMCEAARPYIEAAGVSDRVDTVPVDMFRQPWPTGYDALFFSNIYHDWNDATCAELSAKAFAALPSGGRIFLHEQLLGDNLDGPATTASFSVLMMLGTRGKQYSLPEFTALLEGVGFVDVSATHSCGYYSLVSARKP